MVVSSIEWCGPIPQATVVVGLTVMLTLLLGFAEATVSIRVGEAVSNTQP